MGVFNAEQIAFVVDRPGHDRRYAIDASKIERDLGGCTAETFETGIRKTVQWYLDNEDWVAAVQSGAYRNWLDTNYAERSGALNCCCWAGKASSVGSCSAAWRSQCPRTLGWL